MTGTYLKMPFASCANKSICSSRSRRFHTGYCRLLTYSPVLQHELSYDKFYPDTNRIYRVLGTNIDGKINKGLDFLAPFGKVGKTDFPEIENLEDLMTSPLSGVQAVTRSGLLPKTTTKRVSLI